MRQLEKMLQFLPKNGQLKLLGFYNQGILCRNSGRLWGEDVQCCFFPNAQGVRGTFGKNIDRYPRFAFFTHMLEAMGKKVKLGILVTFDTQGGGQVETDDCIVNSRAFPAVFFALLFPPLVFLQYIDIDMVDERNDLVEKAIDRSLLLSKVRSVSGFRSGGIHHFTPQAVGFVSLYRVYIFVLSCTFGCVCLDIHPLVGFFFGIAW